MRLLILTPFSSFDGVFTQVSLLSQYFQKGSISTSQYVLFPTKKSTAFTNYSVPANTWDINLRRMLLKMKYFFRLLVFIKSQPDFDYVLVMTHIPVYYIIAAKLVLMKKFKTILTIHNSMIYDSSKKNDTYSKLKRRLLLKIGAFFSEKIIASSKDLAKELIKLAHLNNRKCDYIYPGIEVDKASSKAHEPPQPAVTREVDTALHSNNLKLVTLASMQPRKDYLTLLWALTQIIQEKPNTLLFIIGVGPFYKEIRDLVKVLHLDQNIHFVGATDNPYYYLSHADIYVQSSISEGFGLSLLEAMSLGIPVISTKCPHGPRELLASGRAGILVPIADSRALARATIGLLRSKRLRERYGKLAFKQAQKFTILQTVESYSKLLK